MFYGEFQHHIDRKGRIIIPSRLREVAKEHYVEKFFVTRGFEQCLFLFTEDEWRSQESKLKALPFNRKDVRKFNRLYFSGAVDVNCDSQGRILLPSYLKDYAQIKRDAVLVGVSNRIEIWSKELWKDYYEASKDSYEDVAEKLMDEGSG